MSALALITGAGCGLGVMLVILGFRGAMPKPERVSRYRAGERDARLRRVGIAVGVGVIVALATRWPVGGVLAGLLVASWQGLFGGKAEGSGEVGRREAG